MRNAGIYISLFALLTGSVVFSYADDYVDDVYVWQPVARQTVYDGQDSSSKKADKTAVVQDVNGVPTVTTTVRQSPVQSSATTENKRTGQMQTDKPTVRFIQVRDTVVKAVISR